MKKKLTVWVALMAMLVGAVAYSAEPWNDTAHRVHSITLVPGSADTTIFSCVTTLGDYGKYWSCISLANTTTVYITSPRWTGWKRIVIPPGVSLAQIAPDGPYIDSLIVYPKTSSVFFQATINY